MNKELIEALNILEKEKDISKESLFEAIENNLVVAYKNNFNKADNVTVTMDRETGDFHIYSQKEVVEEVMDPVTEISLEDARSIKGTYELGDIVNIEIQSKDFGRIATQSADLTEAQDAQITMQETILQAGVNAADKNTA